jgi:NAD+ kinase
MGLIGMIHFNTIGILAKQHDPRIKHTLQNLVEFLHQQGLQIKVDYNSAEFLDIQPSSYQQLIENIDLAIVVGGDGTLLRAGRLLAAHDIPIVGVNLGRLGFLVDVSPDEMSSLLSQILAGDYTEESRFILAAQVYRGQELIGEGDAVNDIVIHVRNEIRMIEFTTHINQTFVNTQRADGIVISTPTGSTAYSLSGGGPILHPELEAIVLVPICPHSLNNRPIVINSKDTIEISLCKQRNTDARISFDGQSNINLKPADHMIIERKSHSLRLLHPKNYDYYHILRAKLRWSVQP